MMSPRSPAALSLLTGALLGQTFPLGKIASLSTVSLIVRAWLVSFGAGVCLAIARLAWAGRVTTKPVYLCSYRTRAWPDRAHPLELAIGSNLAAAAVLFVLLLRHGNLADLRAMAAVPTAAVLQVVASTAEVGPAAKGD